MNIVDIFKARIQASNTIVLTTHVYPDADGIGSQISLCLALRELGKKAICVNDEPLMERYRYLDPDRVIIDFEGYKNSEFFNNTDLFIVVDTNTTARIGTTLEKIINKKNNVLFIDHHPSNRVDIDQHCISTLAAATGELAGDIIRGLGIKFTKKMALPIYTAILIDTSSFRYPNVTGNTHGIVSELMKTGLHPSEAYNGIYGTKKIPHMHLLGEILSTASTNKREDVAWLVITKKLIEKYHSDIEDTHAFINHLLILDNIKVACMFRDDEDSLKLSLRSTGNYDVGTLAQALGGGGHSHSAATVFKKSPTTNTQEMINEIIGRLEDLIDKMPAV
jgi:phosphoesterase RecJ-like protein